MDNKHSLVIKTGIKCGLVIAILYLILGFAGLWLNMTPAMKSYSNDLAQYEKNIWNYTYQSSYPYSYPSYYSPPAPRPPIEYYFNLLLGLMSLIVAVLGTLATGVFAIKAVGALKYTLKDAVDIGVFAGVAAFVPYFIACIIQIGAMYVLNNSTLTTITSIMPGLSTLFPIMMAGELICCCLPGGIALFAVLAAIGAMGYVFLTKKLEDKPASVSSGP